MSRDIYMIWLVRKTTSAWKFNTLCCLLNCKGIDNISVQVIRGKGISLAYIANFLNFDKCLVELLDLLNFNTVWIRSAYQATLALTN